MVIKGIWNRKVLVSKKLFITKRGKNNVWYKKSRDYVFVNVLSNIGNCTLLQDFVRDYMHPEVAVTDAGTGACTTSGWYNAAKVKFNAMSNADKVVFINDELTNNFALISDKNPIEL